MCHSVVIDLVAALTAAAALTGCGGASKSKAGEPATVVSQQSLTTTSSVPTESASDAANACKRAVNQQRLLSANSKSELSIFCENVTGVVSEDHRVVRTVCKEVAYSVVVTKESARARAYSTCYEQAIRVGH